jgi:protoporphyrinogen oxidase
VQELLGDVLVKIKRKAMIFTHGRYVNYPFQSNLADLPRDVAAACAVEAVRAALDRARGQEHPIKTFKDFAMAHFGAGITREFIEPYNSRLWGVGIHEVTSEWCDRFVPVPDVLEIVEGAIQRRGQNAGYNAGFLYPKEGGIEALPEAIFQRLPRDKVMLNTPLNAIRLREHQALIGDEWVEYEALVSTLPLPVLARLVDDMDLGIEASRLRASRLVYAIGAVRSKETVMEGAQWVYLPGKETPVYRFGVPSNVLDTLAPPGMASFYAEFTPTFDGTKTDMESSVKKVLGMLGMDPDALVFVETRKFPFGYVIFDEHRTPITTRLLTEFGKHRVYSIGRFGAWTYNAMEDAILDGMDAASRLTGGGNGN